MKFVEHTGANWAAVQMKAVEMEIEKQKRDWEEKRLAQRQQEELEKQQSEKEDNEMLTYSREDAMNKVNIRSRKKSQLLGKRKSVSANLPTRNNEKGKKTNGTGISQNGISKDTDNSGSSVRTKRNSRILANQSPAEENSAVVTRTRNSSPRGPLAQRGARKKSDRSVSMHSSRSHVRSPSGSTSRSAAESTSHQTTTTTTTATPYDSDSECSLDVMIDSTDVNDSDSNSNQNCGNDDSVISSGSTMTKSMKESSEDGKAEGTPRTRSRGVVKINLWTLDESPILPPKRQRSNNYKSLCDDQTKEEKQLRADFGVKECKVSIVDVGIKPPDGLMAKPSPKSRMQKRLLTAKNNHTLDSRIQKPVSIARKRLSTDIPPNTNEVVVPEGVRITRQRRNTILLNNTL